jgi:hypothetical protein
MTFEILNKINLFKNMKRRTRKGLKKTLIISLIFLFVAVVICYIQISGGHLGKVGGIRQDVPLNDGLHIIIVCCSIYILVKNRNLFRRFRTDDKKMK